jgi:hypothetical protein
VSGVEVVKRVKNRALDMNLLKLRGCSHVKEEGAPLLLSHRTRRSVAD